jgi:beta-glucosidase
VQNNGVIAMGKHFVANEQETNRMSVAEIVDDQVLHELYLLPFEMMVKDGNVGSLMCSYNTINGHQACQNPDTLNTVLRNQWGFKGYVQSDFGAAHSTTGDLLAGMDLEMSPLRAVWTTDTLNAALKSGAIAESNIDAALLRRYTQMFRMGIFDRPVIQMPIDFVAGARHAQSIGARTLVLLQNNGALPLSAKAQNVVLVGKQTQVYAQQAVAGGAKVGVAFGSGGGSSDVVPMHSVAPIEGIRNVLSKLGNSTGKVHLILVDDTNSTATIDGVTTTYKAALAGVAGADQVIVMAGTISEEGADRASFTTSAGTTLAEVGDNLDWYSPNPSRATTSAAAGHSKTVAMIRDVMGVASTTAKPMSAKTVLVLKDTAGVTMDPSLVGNAGPAILEAWFPGQEDGNIVADALYGVTNPSGKLPVTFPFAGHSFMDSITPNQYPGVPVAGVPTVTYEEQLDIGYRWYDSNSIKPAFPFGFGLSYTTFRLNSKFTPAKKSDPKYYVRTTVTNTGKVEGSEVVQVYLGIPSGAFLKQPPKRLVGFRKVALAPGASATVTITINPLTTNHPLGVWDKGSQQFVIPSGTYTVYAGNSSRNLTTLATFTR